MFLGQRNDANELYQAMDIFLLPSLYEGLGLVLIEAQCSDLICLASDEVPTEAKIKDKLSFLPLELGAEIWCQRILFNSDNYSRKPAIKQIKNKRYDIKLESNHLIKKYMEGLKNVK